MSAEGGEQIVRSAGWLVAAGPRRPSAVDWIVFGTIVAALWVLQHPVTGVIHDTRLYTLLALARLYPAELGNDLFLRFGSQGDFTLFTPIHAEAIRYLGVEPAAGLLTAICLAFWLGAVILLARSLALVATGLAVALVLLVPGDYGIHGFLSYGESFITPRLPTEAMSLAAVAAWVSHRRALAALLLAAAAVVHPLITLPAVLVVGLYAAGPRLSRPGPTLIAAAVVTGALMALATWSPVGPLRLFDEPWLGIVEQRAPYLFPHLWSRADWGRAVWPIVFSWIASGCIEPTAHKRLLQAAAIVAFMGILVSVVASSAVPVVGVTQGQPWRWIWPSKLLAVLLAPAAMCALWSEGKAGRSVAMLLAAAWIMSTVTGLWLAIGALVLWVTRRRLSVDLARAVHLASAIALVTAVAWLLATKVPMSMAQFRLHGLTACVSELVAGGALPVAVALAAWIGAMRSRVGAWLTAAMASLLLLPATMVCEAATQFTYPATLQARFAAWRAVVPPGAQVLWVDDPVSAWILLRRPSYLSQVQGAAAVFSRDAALELQRRALVLSDTIPVTEVLGPPGTAPAAPVWSASALRRACEDPALGFVVSNDALGAAEAAPPVSGASAGSTGAALHLYTCGGYR